MEKLSVDVSTLNLSIVDFRERSGILRAVPYFAEVQHPPRSEPVRRESFKVTKEALEAEARHIAENLSDTNVGVRVKKTLESYAGEISKSTFNARILEFRASSLEHALTSHIISMSLNEWDTKAISEFVRAHKDFTLGNFRDALEAVEKARDLRVMPPEDLVELSTQINSSIELINSSRNVGNRHVLTDDSTSLLRDISEEAVERVLEISSTEVEIPARYWEPIIQSVLAFGRFVYSIGAFGLGTVVTSVTVAGASAAVEAQWPGAFEATYNFFRSVFPDLPPWPF